MSDSADFNAGRGERVPPGDGMQSRAGYYGPFLKKKRRPGRIKTLRRRR